MGTIFDHRKGIKARKIHACHWCPDPIEPGSLYDSWAWADTDSLNRVKVHPECAAAWAEASDNEPGGVYECSAHDHLRGSLETR